MSFRLSQTTQRASPAVAAVTITTMTDIICVSNDNRKFLQRVVAKQPAVDTFHAIDAYIAENAYLPKKPVRTQENRPLCLHISFFS